MIFSGGGWQRSRHGLENVISVVVDFEGRLLHFFDLHIQLRCQLLQFPSRVWRHQGRLRFPLVRFLL